MTDKGLFPFTLYITDKVFKILVLKEDESRGADVHTAEYIDSVATEVRGARLTFQYLEDNTEYITVTNILHDLSVNDYPLKKVKKEVLKMCGLLNTVSRAIAREAGDSGD